MDDSDVAARDAAVEILQDTGGLAVWISKAR